MNRSRLAKPIAALALVVGATVALPAWADDLGNTATWEVPTPGAVQEEVVRWFESQEMSPQQRDKFAELWSDIGSDVAIDSLDRSAATFALTDSQAELLVKQIESGVTLSKQPEVAWLDAEEVDPFVRDNLRLFAARALAQEQFYDESLELLQELTPEQVVDPAALLFYSGVVHHRLLHKEAGLKVLDRLLERSEDIPERYRTLAQLMRGDLKQLEDDSLDHISRRMNDVQRRLDLGRANKKVREIEDGVIESLDKLIEEMEEQQQQQQQASAGRAQGSNRSSKPAENAGVPEGKGRGEVDKKRLGRTSDWGGLPAKEREEAMQEMGRDLPPHYREVIQEYFKELSKLKRKGSK